LSRAAPILALAALGGAATMVVELAAVRLLSPWFGASLAVWTNVIGVILLALALGYLAGGRASRRVEPLRRMGLVLSVGGVATALLPLLSGHAADWFLPESLALDEALPVVVWGSLATSLVLFLVPAALLGMVAPLAVEALQRAAASNAGDAGGRVLAASTLGSLAGVFGTTHGLIPHLGIAWTFLSAAFVLGGAGALALWLARRGRALLLVALLPLSAPWLHALRAEPGGESPLGLVTLARAQSAYQEIRVCEDQSGPLPLRYLQVNEGFDSFQSVWQPDPGFLPEGYYYNYFALPLYWSARETPRPPTARVLVLGLGAGTAWRVLEGAKPPGLELELEGVELDAVVLDMARAHMDLARDDARHRAIGGLDARVALRLPRPPVDLIVLDCYANQIEIPAHLATLEFLREARAGLTPGGWLALNVGGFGFDDPLVRAVGATLAEAFGEALLLRVPLGRNVVLYARRDAPLPLAGGALVDVQEPAQRWIAPLKLPGGFERVEAGAGASLTDDRAPLELLQISSLEAVRAKRKAKEP
jgi:predicted membrane-bound spermidine synthase